MGMTTTITLLRIIVIKTVITIIVTVIIMITVIPLPLLYYNLFGDQGE